MSRVGAQGFGQITSVRPCGPSPQAWRTKRRLCSADELDATQELVFHLQSHLVADSWQTQMYAAALVQNLSSEPAACAAFKPLVKDLTRLLGSEHAIVVRRCRPPATPHSRPPAAPQPPPAPVLQRGLLQPRVLSPRLLLW